MKGNVRNHVTIYFSSNLKHFCCLAGYKSKNQENSTKRLELDQKGKVKQKNMHFKRALLALFKFEQFQPWNTGFKIISSSLYDIRVWYVGQTF